MNSKNMNQQQYTKRNPSQRSRLVPFVLVGGEHNRIDTAAMRRRLFVVIGILASSLTLGVLFYREAFRLWQ